MVILKGPTTNEFSSENSPKDISKDLHQLHRLR